MSYVKYLRDVLGEGFKEFVTKFSSEDENINVYVDKFKLLKTRNKIKGVEADIDYWIKKDYGSFKTYVDSFEESKIKSRNEVKKEAYKNIVAENDEYVIIKINNADEMYAVGKGTVWCIASGEKEKAKGHYEYYTKDSDFYIAIKKNLGEISKLEVNRDAVVGDEESDGKKYSNVYPYWDKIAIQVKLCGDIVYWNTGDFYYRNGSVELSKVNLPKHDFKCEFKIPDHWELNVDGSYDVLDEVVIKNYMLVDGKFPVKFGEVRGDFNCDECSKLVSLEGCPKHVTGNFSAFSCTSLASLEGSPKSVGGNFNCCGCSKLVSLKGAPKSVVSFDCAGCTSLTSLKGAPKSVRGIFNCSGCTSLTSLEGSPKSVGRDFSSFSCTSLTSLDGSPKSVGRDFSCDGCSKLVSLEGAPESVGGNFNCYGCTSLTSLDGASKSVGRDFSCDGCSKLVSLEGAPKSVGRDFSCRLCTSLTSLDGAPETVTLNFHISNCPKLKLSELDKIPLSYRDKVKHDLKESTFHFWNKTYNKLNG